jgi:hypothetical protein
MEIFLTPELICLENSVQETRWIRTLMHNYQMYAIESQSYAKIDIGGYAMEFSNTAEFNGWLNQQISTGWTVTFRAIESANLVDSETLHRLQSRVFQVLRRHTSSK